jgi:LacI family transcriptional regulator
MREDLNTTLKVIARKVGVSVPTVSRVLGGRARRFRISKKTEAAVNRVATELNYTPNRLARSLRLKKSHTLGLLIPDISNPYFATIARSVENTARTFGYSIIFCDSEEDTQLEIESLSLLQGRKVDGLLICPVGESGSHIVPLVAAQANIVLIDRYFPDLRCAYVVSDNYRGARDAATHLIDAGHSVIACIKGLENTSPTRDRVKGYRDAMKLHDLRIDEELIVGKDYGAENGYIETRLLLKRIKRPSAILAFGNLISLGALTALSEEGLKVPDDMSLITFDDQPYLNLLATPMTTVAQQNEEMGAIATKLLIEQIDSPRRSDPVGIVLPTRLVVRNSVLKINRDSVTELRRA